MINELNIAIEYGQPNSVMLQIVERLQEYASTHFKAEEEIFAEYGFTESAEHLDEHTKFNDSIKYIRRQCELLDSPMSAKIRDFLLNWLANHIMTKDKEYKSFIDNHPVQ
jgi:hemerythrin-like metal-binding protein